MSKILIAEDDRFLAAAYSFKLTKAGFETKVSVDGIEALKDIKLFAPDLIIMDLIMPQKDGFSVLEDMANDPSVAHIPVIVLTNLSQKQDQDRALKLGAKDFLVKSNTDPNQLISKINTLLKPPQNR